VRRSAFESEAGHGADPRSRERLPPGVQALVASPARIVSLIPSTPDQADSSSSEQRVSSDFDGLQTLDVIRSRALEQTTFGTVHGVAA
jgi:hypothetical protein